MIVKTGHDSRKLTGTSEIKALSGEVARIRKKNKNSNQDSPLGGGKSPPLPLHPTRQPQCVWPRLPSECRGRWRDPCEMRRDEFGHKHTHRNSATRAPYFEGPERMLEWWLFPAACCAVTLESPAGRMWHSGGQGAAQRRCPTPSPPCLRTAVQPTAGFTSG